MRGGRSKPGQAGDQPLLFEASAIAMTEARDFWPTPIPDGVRCIERLNWKFEIEQINTGARRRSAERWQHNGVIAFDPSCGHGNLLEAARLCGACTTLGIELSPELAALATSKGHAVTRGDSLALEWPVADFLIGNPPFSFALEFAWKTAEWATEHRRPAALLLELNFLASKGRREIHRETRPGLFPLSERISFSGGGETSSRDYAWFVWGVPELHGMYEVW